MNTPLILVEGLKSRNRADVAIALSKHFRADIRTANFNTTEQEFLNWLDPVLHGISGLVIAGSWQTQKVGKLLTPNGEYNSDMGRRLTTVARYLNAVTVHVNVFADSAILAACMEQGGRLTTEQLGLLFRACREWEMPEFAIQPEVVVNPHVQDFVDYLFPAVTEELTSMNAALNALMDDY